MTFDLQGLQEVLVGLLYLAIPKDWQGSKINNLMEQIYSKLLQIDIRCLTHSP